MIVLSQFFKGSDCWVDVLRFVDLVVLCWSFTVDAWDTVLLLGILGAILARQQVFGSCNCMPCMQHDATNSNLGQVQYSPSPTDTKPYQAIP